MRWRARRADLATEEGECFSGAATLGSDVTERTWGPTVVPSAMNKRAGDYV